MKNSNIFNKIKPTSYLFYVDRTNNIESILSNGLGCVNVYDDLHIALSSCEVANPSVFLVDTFTMIEDGYNFSSVEKGVWSVNSIPKEYISLIDKNTLCVCKPLANIGEEVKKDFLAELFDLYSRYGVSISYDNYMEEFVLNRYSEGDVEFMNRVLTSEDYLKSLVGSYEED